VSNVIVAAVVLGDILRSLPESEEWAGGAAFQVFLSRSGTMGAPLLAGGPPLKVLCTVPKECPIVAFFARVGGDAPGAM